MEKMLIIEYQEKSLSIQSSKDTRTLSPYFINIRKLQYRSSININKLTSSIDIIQFELTNFDSK